MRRRVLAAAAIAVLAASGVAPGCGGLAPPPAQAGIEGSAIDWSVDPCADLYQFACGNWKRWNGIPAELAARAHFNDVQQGLIDDQYTLVVDDVQGRSHAADPDAAKIGAFDQACLAALAGDARTGADLARQLQLVAGVATLGDLATVLGTLRAAGTGALVDASVIPNPDAPAANELILVPGALEMDVSYYTDADKASFRAAYRDHVNALVAATSGANDLGTPPTPDVVLSVETALAAASPTPAAARDAHATHNPTPLPAFEALAPSFAWDAYFAAAGVPAPASVDAAWPAFWPSLEHVLETTSVADPQGVRDLARARDGGPAARRHRPGRRVRVRQAVLGQHGATAGLLAMLPGRARPARLCAVAAVRGRGLQRCGPREGGAAHRDDPPGLRGHPRWRAVDGRTDLGGGADEARGGHRQDRLPRRLDGLRRLLARRARLPRDDGGAVDLGLGRRVERGWSAGRSHALVGGTSSRTRSTRTSSTTSHFPAAILQHPFFDVARSPAANYGSIGAVMGHELTHGFDDQGRQYDGTGQLRDWWSPAVATAFQQRAQCIVDQFDAVHPLPGTMVNGTLTLGETIADLGGLKLAYAAFHASTGGNGQGAPGPFSPDQEFFVAFAQGWCENDRASYIETELESDPHPPWHDRINGAVRNVPAFAQAFGCPSGAPLAPASRCEVW